MQTSSLSGNEEFDVIVVGAGVGGCIAAARIAQFGVNPRNGEKLKIALFEWGAYHKGDVKRGYGIPSRRAAFDGMPFELARRYMLPWGTLGMVGGSTHWAGMIAHPPEAIDFDHWRAETGVDWTWENFTYPLVEVREMWHPYPEPDEVRSPGQKRFKEVALALGYNVYEAAQAKLNCPRCGDCNGRVCRYDAKSTPLVTYVPIAEKEGVKIFAETPVEKIVIEKKGSRPVATGVVYRKDGSLHQARGNTIIAACGYNGTPRLLYRSGYGPREKVQGELIVENANVGKWLVSSLNVPGANCWFDWPIKYPDIGTHGVYYIERTTPRGMNDLVVREDFGSREGTGRFPEDFAMSALAPDFGRDFKAYMKDSTTHVGNIGIELSKNPLRGEIDTSGRSVFGGLVSGEGEAERGGIRSDFIAKNFPAVIETLMEGKEIVEKVVKELAPKKVNYRKTLPEQLGTNHNHGSCRAGASKENSVVNSDLESHDVDNLFICDASVLPFQSRANPSMPTAAVCSHGWRRMVAKHFSHA